MLKATSDLSSTLLVKESFGLEKEDFVGGTAFTLLLLFWRLRAAFCCFFPVVRDKKSNKSLQLLGRGTLVPLEMLIF